MSRKRARSPAEPQQLHLYSSTPITDRASTFIGYFSATSSAEALQSNPEIQSASHRIAAWRQRSTQRSLNPYTSSQKASVIYDIGHDDDGEKYGGKKLERVLIDMDIEGAVVVARWYGGIMLGPVRFTHIEECARQAIKKWKSDAAITPRQDDSLDEQHGRAKAPKVKELAPLDREKLERVLKERDQSIVVLRYLLAEKRNNGTPESSSSPAQKVEQANPKAMDYSAMPTNTLKKLEVARDATISFILKEIDKVEKATQLSNDG